MTYRELFIFDQTDPGDFIANLHSDLLKQLPDEAFLETGTVVPMALPTRNLRVDRRKLINKLESHRDQHLQEHEEAMMEYHELAMKSLVAAEQEILDSVKKQSLKARAQLADKSLDLRTVNLIGNSQFMIDVTPPPSFIEDYDRAIELFEAGCEDEVELNPDEVARYIHDDWEWQRQFKAATAFYNSKS